MRPLRCLILAQKDYFRQFFILILSLYRQSLQEPSYSLQYYRSVILSSSKIELSYKILYERITKIFSLANS